ncbi:MAG: hypothetical protein IT324_30380 [Anaerolineae bacterium]|nr:hypothetical protein [Anaerolineae bacterium]
MRFAAILVLLLSSIIAAAIGAGMRTEGSTFTIPESQYLPGAYVPANARCDFYMVIYENDLYCSLNNLYFAADRGTRVILRTTMMTPGLKTGALFKLWGTPVGERRYGLSRYIYWRNRVSPVIRAFAYDRWFSPDSEVFYITFILSEDISALPRWEGYRQ